MPKKERHPVEEDADDTEIESDDVDETGDIEKKEKRRLYNNQDLMKTRLEQMKSKFEWLQHLDITTSTKDLSIPGDTDEKEKQVTTTDIEDDFKREMTFYCQAQVAAKEALSKLRDLGVPTQRPEDYFAEMVKSDVHMQKIRQKLVNRKESMEKSEKAKKQRQLKKFGKKIQHEVLQKRQKEKKKMLQEVDRIKKNNKNKMDKLSGKDNDDDIFNVKPDNKRQNLGQKRKRKDDKFGFGGKKRKLKKNSAESSGEMNSFKSDIHGKKRQGKPGKPGKFGKGGAAKGKPKRLGKSRRMQGRSKK